MDFPGESLSEAEELDQIVEEIRAECSTGEFSETGEVQRAEQILFGPDEHPCNDVRTEHLDKLLREGRIRFDEEANPYNNGTRRRIYEATLW
jgi:hypothetical protein